ncbi:MAG: hypothetical protein IPN32_24590 [Deltaproteobacteria bacterium]|nr:hypothetical protein [Deltaproteobacteria bacterium]
MTTVPAANIDADALRSRYVEVQRLADGAEGGSFLAREPGGAKVVCKPVPAASLPAVRFAFDLLRAAASPHLPAPRELWTGPSGHPWMITDWIEGAPMAPARQPADVALAEVLAVARALAVIHRAGTHHGDVSLGNVVVTPTRGCVLVDLAQLGRLGSGTPGFLAPEVLAGGGGPAADRFALGSLACARLFGEVPWRRPEALVGLTAAAVRARLDALGANGLQPAVVELLAGLLDPDPTRRPADAAALVHRLEQLQWLARADRPALPVARWHLPTRAPYRGVDPAPCVARVIAGPAADPLRLVVVAGPDHSGRRRLVEEIVQGVQLASTRDARLAEPVHDDDPSAWLERWLTAPPGAVIGWRLPLDAATLPRQAATAVAAASLTHAIAVVAAPPAWADALASLASPAVMLVHTRPWQRDELDAALAESYDGESQAVREAVLAHTGGWSGRVVRAFAACARARDPLFDRTAIERALAATSEAEPMVPAIARAVLRAHWRVATGDEARALPGHLHDGEQPLGSAVMAARVGLGDDAVESLARTELAGHDDASLSLALDADAAAAVQSRVQRQPPRPGSADAAALVRWVQRRRGGVPPSVLAITARVLLAEGASSAALALVDARREPELSLEAARALQRLGRAEDALARLPRAPAGTRGDLALQIEGLALRLLVDLGRAEEAVRGIDDGALAGHGIGCATFGLWAGYARLAIDDREGAERTLAAVDAAVAGLDDPRAAGLRARALQLQGNLALARGELARAASVWAAAAAAFVEGGEPVGELALRGSLCGLCVQSFAAEGLVHGRVALRGLLVRGDHDALATAAVNLAQLLARTGARDELAVLCQGLATALGAWAPAAAQARRERAQAELAWCDAVARSDRDGWQQARNAFDHAARRLARCELHAEASESWARACACARAAARLDVAAGDLASARLEARRAGDDDPWRIVVEECALAAARGVNERSAAALSSLGSDQLDGWLARGQLDRAWAVTRTAWAATRVGLPLGHPQRERMARRVLHIQESIMDKTAAADRAAVRTPRGRRASERRCATSSTRPRPASPAPPWAQPRPPACRRSGRAPPITSNGCCGSIAGSPARIASSPCSSRSSMR